MSCKLIFILLFLIGTRLFAQNPPAEILNYDIGCLVDKHNKLTVTKGILIKINSPSGRDHAVVKIYYDNISSIKNIECTILNTQNGLIKSFRKNEISDFAALSGYFHTDDRYKEIKAYHHTYPYLIKLEYSQEFAQFISFPVWYPQNGENIPLKKSTYKLTVPTDFSFHYKFYNFKPEAELHADQTVKTYIWRTENLSPVFLQESFLPPIRSLYPMARFIPDSYVFGGIKGSSVTWRDLGNWQSELITGLDKLPETEIQKLHLLTKNTDTDVEKVKLIYQYLQNETRYVGVLIGIGGWKPYEASYVCNNRYGDCKALTNYMMAMLSTVGISSYYSLIVADEGEPDIDTSFPGMYFNHVVLYVPLHNDTLWLECTSQTNPPGYWGAFTNGRHALVCDFENSFIVQTPQFKKTENFIHQTSVVDIEDGKLNVTMKRELFGEAGEKVRNNLTSGSEKDFRETAMKIIPFKNYTLYHAKYDVINQDDAAGYSEDLTLTFSNNIQSYGSNIIISPFNSYFKIRYPLNIKRQNPISVLHDFRLTDTIQYNIPEEFELDALPGHFQSSTRYGKYEVSYVQEKNKLIVRKLIELNKGNYSPAEYIEFKAFINGIMNIENQKILLKKL